ncbi:hypothetical protein BT67DRAFT_445015 [Trichocladium antarcticum]|uniref:Uncharacterized protein n=1 Tax=Trichocladium antarcticum TaxID=1450529 RepID=A0AAN6UDK3_9PEZI|nr:hypothetical protein BT67DRAFT_445015 [Trichocladium antarcticum]
MEPDGDSARHNSITVGGAVAGPDNSDDASSTHSTPEVTMKSDDEVMRPSTTGPSIKDRSNTSAMVPVPRASRPASYDYEFSDIDELTMRQLDEDIQAYKYDLEYCRAQLEAADLTPQETRTLQLRTLDLGHQIRHCKHRIESVRAQARKQVFRPPHGTTAHPLMMAAPSSGSTANGRGARNVSGGFGGVVLPGKRASAATPAPTAGKRPGYDDNDDDDDMGAGAGVKRIKVASSPDLEMMEEGVNTALQRLGFWKCRLCSAPKYLLAGSGRTPAAPCKWPLKDISKMITHFTEMHVEHSPSERCTELGAALSQNRGPFEYWLRRTRAQNISDGGIIDDCLDRLLHGEMPVLLRRHSRAAAGMPVS